MPVKQIRKLINFEIKNINEEERAFDAVASTEAIDRDGDILRAAGWDIKNYKKNPVVLWAHDYSSFPIAKSMVIKIEDNKLIFRPQFATKEQNPVADQAYQLYKGGFLKTFSVGFMPKKWEEREDENYPYGREYTKQELLEISGCPVPSNPEALGQAAVKSLLEKTLEGVFTNPKNIKGEKEEYNCECIECGHKMTSEKHCKDIKCPECGGQMRRLERPGPGQESYDGEKSGRVLSAINRTLIKSCVAKMTDSISALEALIEATEIEQDSQNEDLTKLLGNLKEVMSKL